MSVHLHRAVTCINVCLHIKKIQTLAATPLPGHKKILHTLIGMGSAALAAAVPYHVRQPEFHIRDKEILPKNCITVGVVYCLHYIFVPLSSCGVLLFLEGFPVRKKTGVHVKAQQKRKKSY